MKNSHSRRQQGGITLIESLCALLIFSVGILGLTGLHATAVQQSTAAEQRSVAAMLANDLISRMWLSDRTAAVLQAAYGTSGAGYTNWLAQVQGSGLPGVADYPPSVSFQPFTGGGTSAVASSIATITIQWKAPGDTTPHRYVALTQLQ